MKKLLILMVVLSLVLVSGCAGKKDKSNPKPKETKQEQKTENENTKTENEQVIEITEPQFTPESAKEVTSVDVNNMSQGDLDSLVEMFNSEDSTPEQKEAARIQLEQIFKQAEANGQ